jgi:hypothetical protein
MNPHGVTYEKEALMLYTYKYLDGSQWQATTLDGTEDVPPKTTHESLFFSFGRTLLKTDCAHLSDVHFVPTSRFIILQDYCFGSVTPPAFVYR